MLAFLNKKIANAKKETALEIALKIEIFLIYRLTLRKYKFDRLTKDKWAIPLLEAHILVKLTFS